MISHNAIQYQFHMVWYPTMSYNINFIWYNILQCHTISISYGMIYTLHMYIHLLVRKNPCLGYSLHQLVHTEKYLGLPALCWPSWFAKLPSKHSKSCGPRRRKRLGWFGDSTEQKCCLFLVDAIDRDLRNHPSQNEGLCWPFLLLQTVYEGWATAWHWNYGLIESDDKLSASLMACSFT